MARGVIFSKHFSGTIDTSDTRASAPSFPEPDITLASGKTLRILARNLDSEHINRFIQSATLNGVPLDNAWFRHQQVANGGTLVVTMGSAPTKWGTTNPPPSMSDSSSTFCAAMQP
ncbi:MAG: glycoside hydrolase family 92 protein [Terracidiphilus sp.]|nr:glycoside hydrolase family 92 protein [Terracidiphilus sp.]MDR3796868.1 glycoside hydrolase family 92 protein [Terracidiphilus sp.]